MIVPKGASGMLRFIGRILIAIAAGLLLYSGITGIINGVHTIQKAGGWDAFFDSRNFLADMFVLIISGLYILLALPAVFGVIRGKCGFWMLLFSILLGALVGFTIYRMIQAGGFTDAKAVWDFVVSILMPICYVGGTLLILFHHRGKANQGQ